MKRYTVRYSVDWVRPEWIFLYGEPIESLAGAEGLSSYYEDRGYRVEILETTYVVSETKTVYRNVRRDHGR